MGGRHGDGRRGGEGDSGRGCCVVVMCLLCVRGVTHGTCHREIVLSNRLGIRTRLSRTELCVGWGEDV